MTEFILARRSPKNFLLVCAHPTGGLGDKFNPPILCGLATVYCCFGDRNGIHRVKYLLCIPTPEVLFWGLRTAQCNTESDTKNWLNKKLEFICTHDHTVKALRLKNFLRYLE